MLCLALQFNVFCFLVVSVYAVQPLVETTHGEVAGKVLRTLLKDVEYYAFVGIPYAAPPVKSLRFMVRCLFVLLGILGNR